MEDLSLHILDIVENPITTGATKIEIRIIENIPENLLLIEVTDNGKGMDKDTAKKVMTPFSPQRQAAR